MCTLCPYVLCLEVQHHLWVNSFEFKVDEEGRYIRSIKQNKKISRWHSQNCNTKRKKVTGNVTCPLKMLKFLSKTNPNAFHLFNKCAKDAIFCPKDCKLQMVHRWNYEKAIICYFPSGMKLTYYNRRKCQEKWSFLRILRNQDSQNLKIVPYSSVNSNLPVNNDLSCSNVMQSDFSI